MLITIVQFGVTKLGGYLVTENTRISYPDPFFAISGRELLSSVDLNRVSHAIQNVRRDGDRIIADTKRMATPYGTTALYEQHRKNMRFWVCANGRIQTGPEFVDLDIICMEFLPWI